MHLTCLPPVVVFFAVPRHVHAACGVFVHVRTCLMWLPLFLFANLSSVCDIVHCRNPFSKTALVLIRPCLAAQTQTNFSSCRLCLVT
ncbi:hypothetical protein B0H13DRAFT_2002108 [Mycena leptocephala]|nr:hypothetical protein B0H13DRAFT_2002108 [Mycena leptocephala]